MNVAEPPESSPSETGPPELSVIVVSCNGDEMLDRCLAALAGQAEPARIELLAVGRWSDRPELAPLRSRFPAVRWVDAPSEETVPQLRSRGIRSSRGAVVALLEDDCVVSEGWCDLAITAHRAGEPAVGGPIEPDDYDSSLDWAVYLCEYGRFKAPFEGIVRALPGNNVAYRREALERLQLEEGFYEVFVHWAWQRQGVSLRASNGLMVRNINRWSMPYLTRVPYHHGRAFAGRRWEGAPAWRRALTGAVVLLLPLLQVGRIGREAIRRRRLIGRLAAALPFIGLFTASWAYGELVGALLGPGESAQQWR